jgi:mitogen-activated protein kinase organizer 1
MCLSLFFPEMSIPLPSTVAFELEGHTGAVQCIKYTCDCEYIMTTSTDTMRLFNARTGALVKTYKEHGKAVLGIAMPKLSNDNSRFASCSADRQVFLWDVVTGRTLRRYAILTQI